MIPVSLPLAQDPNSADYVHPVLQAALPVLTLVDDLLEGPLVMWRKASVYLKQWPDENDATYRLRSQCEPLFMGLKRTVGAGVGMLWGKPPTMTWNGMDATGPAFWDNVDGLGTKGTVFGARLSERVMAHGLCVLLIDHTQADAAVVPTAANETTRRVLWRVYARRNVLNWSTEIVNGITQLRHVTLREVVSRADGAFGLRTVERYRVVRVVDGVATWVVFERSTERGQEATLIEVATGVFRDRTGNTRDTLPLVVAAIGDPDVTRTFAADVVMQGTAFSNLAHWGYASNLRFNREVSGYEQLVVTGNLLRGADDVDPNLAPRLRVGPLVGIHVEQGGSVMWIGPSGKGLEQQQRGCAEKMAEMDQQGLGFLLPHSASSQRTATEVRMTTFAQLSTLADVGTIIEDALNVALEITAWYAGIEKADAPTAQLHTDFDAQAMDAQTMTVYGTLVGMGFPKRLLLRALQDGGRIPEDEDLSVVEDEWEGSAAAAERIKAEELALQAGDVPRPDTVGDDTQATT